MSFQPWYQGRLTNEQLDELQSFIDHKDDVGQLAWWNELGKRLGFKAETVMGTPNGDHLEFMAEPLDPTDMDGTRLGTRSDEFMQPIHVSDIAESRRKFTEAELIERIVLAAIEERRTRREILHSDDHSLALETWRSAANALDSALDEYQTEEHDRTVELKGESSENPDHQK